MTKFKKCPRCDINYITEDKEYCDICEAEMRGITFNEEIDEEDEGILSPKCHVNYLNDGETICESCATLEIEGKEKTVSRIEEELEWDKEPEEEETVDENDIIMPDEVSLETLAEEEAWDDTDDLGDESIKPTQEELDALKELDEKFDEKGAADDDEEVGAEDDEDLEDEDDEKEDEDDEEKDEDDEDGKD